MGEHKPRRYIYIIHVIYVLYVYIYNAKVYNSVNSVGICLILKVNSKSKRVRGYTEF